MIDSSNELRRADTRPINAAAIAPVKEEGMKLIAKIETEACEASLRAVVAGFGDDYYERNEIRVVPELWIPGIVDPGYDGKVRAGWIIDGEQWPVGWIRSSGAIVALHDGRLYAAGRRHSVAEILADPRIGENVMGQYCPSTRTWTSDAGEITARVELLESERPDADPIRPA